MKNQSLSIFLATMILISVVTSAKAAKSNNSEDTNSNSVKSTTISQGSMGQEANTGTQKTTATPSTPTMQVKNQIETKNQGEDSQLQVKTQEETGLSTGSGTTKNESPRNDIAEEKMSGVANQVEELIVNQTINGGIGEQVKQIATEEKQTQEQVEAQLNQVENRKGLLKFLIGPDYKVLKTMEKQIEENQLRIDQLTQLKTQLTNQSEITMLEETIQAMIDQKTQLQETVTSETQTKSVLGWLFKYFAR